MGGAADGVVETRSGRVRGGREGPLWIFRGIPYARPPVGPRRWRAPEPEAPWTGVRDAVAFGPSAPQRPMQLDFLPGMDVGPQDEDCLSLNVYTPAPDRARRPVLVWIHGGAFVIGSGSQAMYDARRLAAEGDAVVVTINYRLGALGFLHLGPLLGEDFADAGNLGILDQIAALRWVRENVEAFGGDPGNVTIFGESAGGMSVATLLGTPAARGSFDRAIPQSGAAHAAGDAATGALVAEKMLEALGLPRADARRLLDTPVEALLAAQDAVALQTMGTVAFLPFRPVVDGRTLPRPPLEAIAEGLSADVPVLVGATRDEWKLFAVMDPTLRSLDEAGAVQRLARWVGEPARTVYDAYRAAREGVLPTDPRSIFLAIETDRIFRVPAIRLAEAQQAHQPRTYQYLFTWESPLFGDLLGACHGVDVPFVFGIVDAPGADKFIGTGPEVRSLAERTMGAWLASAPHGEPGHPDLPAWPAFEPPRRATMLLGPECRVADDPFGAERAAWTGLL